MLCGPSAPASPASPASPTRASPQTHSPTVPKNAKRQKQIMQVMVTLAFAFSGRRHRAQGFLGVFWRTCCHLAIKSQIVRFAQCPAGQHGPNLGNKCVVCRWKRATCGKLLVSEATCGERVEKTLCFYVYCWRTQAPMEARKMWKPSQRGSTDPGQIHCVGAA